MNKKGSIMDILYAGAAAVFVIFIFIMLGFVFNTMYDEVLPTLNATEPRIGTLMTDAESGIEIIINIIAFVPIFMGIAALILAYFVPSHPIFLPISFVMTVINVFVSFYFSNALNEFFTAGGAITAYINNFPLIVIVGQNLPAFAAVFSVLIMIVMYTRRNVIGGVSY